MSDNKESGKAPEPTGDDWVAAEECKHCLAPKRIHMGRKKYCANGETRYESNADVRLVRPVDRSVLGSEETNLVPLPITDDRNQNPAYACWKGIAEPQAPEDISVAEAIEELKELALEEDYRADSFTLQPLRKALQKQKEAPDAIEVEYRYKTSEEAKLLPLPLQLKRLEEINIELCRNHNTLLVENVNLGRQLKAEIAAKTKEVMLHAVTKFELDKAEKKRDAALEEVRQLKLSLPGTSSLYVPKAAYLAIESKRDQLKAELDLLKSALATPEVYAEVVSENVERENAEVHKLNRELKAELDELRKAEEHWRTSFGVLKAELSELRKHGTFDEGVEAAASLVEEYGGSPIYGPNVRDEIRQLKRTPPIE